MTIIFLLELVLSSSVVASFRVPGRLNAGPLWKSYNSMHTKFFATADSLENNRKNIELLNAENPKSDTFTSRCFHHVEFYCGDATFAYKRFMLSLGMEFAVKSDLSTGNDIYASYGIESSDLRMIFTAPYTTSSQPSLSSNIDNISIENTPPNPFPGFHRDIANNFTNTHGLGVRAVAIEVEDVSESFSALTRNGARAVLPPTRLDDQEGRGYADIAEISLYGDVVLRLLNKDKFHGRFLPNFKDVRTPLPPCPWNTYTDTDTDTDTDSDDNTYKLQRFDHIVGNLHSLSPKMEEIKAITGFHEFAEFTAEDVGTVDSGLNSVVLANNNEAVLLPLNEPTFGTPRKSQIQTYLEQNAGEGVQHMALFTPDIFYTIPRMRSVTPWGGFELMDRPDDSYYHNLPNRLGDALSPEQYRKVREQGILADKDEEGVLLQVFTKPVGDRPTLFLEIIQRIGCVTNKVQKPGCGGFGKGNFKDLFKSIESYERTLKI